MKVVIVDDEALARERLRGLLADHADAQLVAEVDSGLAAIDACQRHNPDVVLLDIAMPGMDGLEAARLLAQLPHPPAVVFCTAYDAHALSAFEAAALDYLMKPIRAERLASALARVRTFMAGQQQPGGREHAPRQQLCARLRGSLRLIPVADIRYLQAEEKYVVVHHARGQDLVEDSLKALEDEFGDSFVRIHRNCLVARAQLLELRRHQGTVQAILRDEPIPLEVSRRCVSSLRSLLEG
ncbi:chemotaxis protein CheY [Stenotrophomonas ginsengisoli]|uniref:Chemotaxis protein CheY n=1 Tax=Stenotrophomonas ginsengisoli TaxID=336566 RepID=A0A0R0D7P9_9GAMM|nr:LytTR family DNA-binding domain-containing protein [Stenotrophomonas ginsengisoli]KRG78255.1 chemotaxis protein CheY [Stenotrophomonas ginsengisoli]